MARQTNDPGELTDPTPSSFGPRNNPPGQGVVKNAVHQGVGGLGGLVGGVVRGVGGALGAVERFGYKAESAAQDAAQSSINGPGGAAVGAVQGWNHASNQLDAAGSGTARIRNGRTGQNGALTPRQQTDDWMQSGQIGRPGGKPPLMGKPVGSLDESTQTNFDKSGMSQKQIWDTTVGRGWVLGGRKIAAEDRGVKWAGSVEQQAAQQRLPGDKNFNAQRDIDRGPVGGRLQRGTAMTEGPMKTGGQAAGIKKMSGLNKPDVYPQNFMGPIPATGQRGISAKEPALNNPFLTSPFTKADTAKPKPSVQQINPKSGAGQGSGLLSSASGLGNLGAFPTAKPKPSHAQQQQQATNRGALALNNPNVPKSKPKSSGGSQQRASSVPSAANQARQKLNEIRNR